MGKRALSQKMEQPLMCIYSLTSPVEKLNDDCLLLIFREVRPQITTTISFAPREIHDRNLALLRLRGVQRSWRGLIESRPELWNTIFFSTFRAQSIDSASIYLQLSKRAPLYVFISGGFSDILPDKRRITVEFVKSLSRAAARVMCLNLSKPDSKMVEIWSTPAPRIREVSISGVMDANTSFRAEMPSLRSMVAPLSILSAVPVRNMLRELTSLTIYQNTGRYNLQQLAGFLRRAPRLRVLKLQNMIAQDGEALAAIGDVPLPLLERLELLACNRKIAELLEIPPQTSISVFFPDFLNDCLLPGFVERTATTFLPSSFLKSTTLSLTVAIRGDGRTNVEVSSREIAHDRHCHLRVQLGQGSHLAVRYAGCLLACGVVRHLSSVANLNIHVSVPKLPMRLTPWLTGFPELQTLRVTGKHMSQVLRDLMHVDAHALPSLQNMVLEQNLSRSVAQALQRWLASRKQAGVPVERIFIPIDVDAA